MNYLHIFGIFLKNLYLLRRSFPRLISLFYWATVDLILWGFVTLWIQKLTNDQGSFDFILVILSGLIFWDLFLRAQQSFSIGLLEDIWARNIINIFASPTRPIEFVLALALYSLVQGLLAFLYVSILATLLYSLHIWELGFYVIPFFLNIFIFGWALGLFTIGLIIRLGPSFEILAWSIPFLFLPFSAVYYPISVFPAAIQSITTIIPTRHLFEGMRAIITQSNFPLESVLWATSLNVLYFALGLLFFYWMLHIARKRGLIARLVTD